MPIRQNYSIWCITENALVYEESLTAPTTCPNNPAHVIGNVQFDHENAPTSTLYDAVVAPNVDDGDYTSIAQAFADGNKNVFVKNGTYNESSSIIMPDRSKIVGESPGGVSVIFSGTNGIKIDASNGVKQSTGTISVVNNSKAVTGLGTSFTSLLVGDFILIGGIYMQIAIITDDTSLQLLNRYRGPTRSGENYIAQTMYTGVTLRFLSVTSPMGTGLYFRACRFCNVQNVILAQCSQNLSIADSGDIGFEAFMSINALVGPSIRIDNSVNIYFNYCNVLNNLNDGVNIVNGCNSITFTTGGIACNAGDGISAETGSININISAITFRQNSNNGVNIKSTASNAIMDGCIFEDNVKAVQVDGNTCVISDCDIYNNGSGIELHDESTVNNTVIENCIGNGIDVLGNKCIIAGNRVKNNGGTGIRTTGNDGVFNSNMVYGNTLNGLELEITADDNIVTSNNLKGNLGTNFSDLGTGTISNSNLT